MTEIAIATCFRYEPDWLIDDWQDSVEWADHVIAINTRHHKDPWIPREQRVQWMIEQAEKTCEWLFILDVDERLSYDAEVVLRDVVDRWRPGLPFAFKFPLWEFFTPTERRVDGVWGGKTRRRFFHIQSRKADMARKPTFMLHPVIAHTHHIDPANDAARVAKHNAHNTWDRAGRTGEGFDYLADRSGMLLRYVEPGQFPELKPWRFEMEEE